MTVTRLPTAREAKDELDRQRRNVTVAEQYEATVIDLIAALREIAYQDRSKTGMRRVAREALEKYFR